MKSTLWPSVILGLIFLIIGIVSLPQYGVNWDEPVHFGRGQAILRFFLTGKKDYKDFELESPTRRSFYQSDGYTYAYLESNYDSHTFPIIGAGHPPLSDLVASVVNRIVYGGLGILGDIESYHLYSIVLSSILIGCVTYFVASKYGLFSGIVAGLSFILYPLFLGESRFNIKDPPEAVYYALTALSFYLGITQSSLKWLLLSSIFAGLAFGTKLNIVFLFVTFGLWVLVLWVPRIRKMTVKGFLRKHKIVIGASLLFIVVPLFLYFATWPLLWSDPITRFLYNFSYYKTVGVGATRFNTYAAQWIVYTTPLSILALVALGILYTLRNGMREKNKTSLFVLLWFLVPVARVSIPGTVIYGGVRQIMEYVPAMAILSGIGAKFLLDKFKSYRMLVQIVVIASFVPITLKMISMHPNESVYFNPLIGGLKGAAQKNIPGWGNSLGSTYRQGVKWINTHAQEGAKVATIYGLRSNIALSDLRPDLLFENRYRSGPARGGEYILGVIHEGSDQMFLRKYLDRYLSPVYEVNVDGVPVLRVWKNDIEHTKDFYRRDESMITVMNPIVQDANRIDIDVGSLVKITRLVVSYKIDTSCTLPENGYVEFSTDGVKWYRSVNDFVTSSVNSWYNAQPEPGVLQVLFAAEPARFIRMVIQDEHSCLLQAPIKVAVKYL